MKITLAKTAGFCFGVNRAVQMVYDLVDSGERVCTLGPIIHNSQMVQELTAKGVRVVNEPCETLPNEKLVIRSHGVGKQVYQAAERSCPRGTSSPWKNSRKEMVTTKPHRMKKITKAIRRSRSVLKDFI